MKKSIDMTNGVPWRLMIPFAIPIFLSGLIEQLYGLADTAIVGRFLGVEALASISCTGSISSLLFGLIFGMSNGLVVIVSQRFGAKDERGIKDSVAISICVCTVLTITLSVLGCVFAGSLLNFINVPDNIIDNAHAYLLTIFIGSIATVIYTLFASILRAVGDSKTPLVILIISAILNVLLNIIFIAGFKMGVVGAGIATIISKIVACVYCVIYTKKNFPILNITKENFRINPGYLRAHIKLALPMALQYSVYQFGGTITASFINTLGSTALASFSAAGYVSYLPVNILSAIASANSTFVAQNMGAAKYGRIKSGVKTVTVMISIVAVFGAIFAILTSDIFVHIIVGKGHPEIENYVLRYIITICPTFFTQGMIYAYRSPLVSMGQTLLPFIYGFIELAARVATAATLIPAIGFDGAGLSLNASMLTMATLSFITYIVYMRKHHGTAFKTQKESA